MLKERLRLQRTLVLVARGERITGDLIGYNSLVTIGNSGAALFELIRR